MRRETQTARRVSSKESSLPSGLASKERNTKYIDKMHKEKWIGHHEVLYPTMLYLAGFKLRDFGGLGEFVMSEDKSRFYLETSSSESYDGTMRSKNPHSQISDVPRNKLVHPVKPVRKANNLQRSR